MNLQEAKDILTRNTSDLFTASYLKKIFRKEAFTYHPDYGGKEEDFKVLQQAFEELEPKAQVFVDGQPVGTGELRTMQGISLTDLGKGYPLTTSAHSCDDCDGNGWRQYESSEVAGYETCTQCEGEGMHCEKCHKCKGTGDYFHLQAKRVTGVCFMCGGTGKFYPIRPARRTFFGAMFGKYKELPNKKRIPVHDCKECNGRGETPIPSGKFFYSKCDKCRGVGEIKIYNPVLPRGYLAGARS